MIHFELLPPRKKKITECEKIHSEVLKAFETSARS